MALFLPQTLRLEQDLGLDWLFSWRGEQASSPRVMVAAMDRASSNALGYRNIPRKWKRTTHANLISALNNNGARTIGYDVLFSEPREGDQDQRLAQAIDEAGNVILFENLFTTNQQGYRMESLEPPIDLLKQAALDVAPFALPKVPAKVTQTWLFKTGAGDQPTLPMVMLHAYFNPFLEEFVTLLTSSLQDIERPRPEWLSINTIPTLPSDQASHFRWLFYQNPDLGKVASKRVLAYSDNETKAALLSWVYALTRGNSIVLNHYGPARSISTTPIHELLDPKPNQFEGQAVFVGFSEILQPEQMDDFYTAYSSDDGIYVSGVELMATTFANLLDRHAIEPLASWQRIVIVFILGAMMTAAFFATGVMGSLMLAASLSGLWSALTLWAFSQHQLWLPLTTIILIQIPISLLMALVWHHRQSQHSKQALTKGVKRFLPNEVVDHLDRTGEVASGQTIPAICLFTDMESFTPLGDQNDPQQLGQMLNTYFKELQPAIDNHGGEVQDMTGDSMLALWSHETTDASRACYAALAIREKQSSIKVQTRIGLHAGDIYRGPLGSESHTEFRPIGDTVNTAKRLESLNKELGTGILASRIIVDRLENWHTRRMGTFLLKGKSQPIEVFEIKGPTDQISEANRHLDLKFEQAVAYFESECFADCVEILETILNNTADKAAEYYRNACLKHLQH